MTSRDGHTKCTNLKEWGKARCKISMTKSDCSFRVDMRALCELVANEKRPVDLVAVSAGHSEQKLLRDHDLTALRRVAAPKVGDCNSSASLNN